MFNISAKLSHFTHFVVVTPGSVDNVLWKLCVRACAGRRGTKRKAEAEAAEVVEEKPSAAEKVEVESGQEGQRVVIEHWYVSE